MHIPNGFLDPKVSAGLGIASAGALAWCFAKVRELVTSPALQEAFSTAGKAASAASQKARRVLSGYGEKFIIKMGAVAALIFAAQMFNFPVSQGTSGHLLGGVLAAVVLGPWAGAIVVSVILLVQSVFFADGGILVLGANIFNMAVIGAIGGYYVYYGISRIIRGSTGIYAGAAIAAWLSVFVAAGATALELALSGTFSLADTMRSMLSVHAVIGLAEAAITVAAIGLLGMIDPKMKIGGEGNE